MCRFPRIVLAAVLTLSAVPSQAQQQPARDSLDRGAIGVFARAVDRLPSVCTIELTVVNNTASTITAAIGAVEVFWGERSVVGNFALQLADPGRIRETRMVVMNGCQTLPSRVVLRQMQVCMLQGQMIPRPACGAPWQPLTPAGAGPDFGLIPTEVAADFTR